MVSRLITKAEYKSITITTCELKWLKRILSSLGVTHPTPIKLYRDSQSMLHIAQSSVFNERTKHIEILCHFLWDERTIHPTYVSPKVQLADIFTKALRKH